MQREHFDLDLERAVLNACLCSEDAFSLVLTEIEANDFYLKAHAEVFSAMLACMNANEPLSLSFLKKHKNLDERILNEIIATPSVVDFIAYAKELREKSVKRQLLNFAHLLPSKINEDRSVSEITDEISKDLFQLSNRTHSNDMKEVQVALQELIEEFERLKKTSAENRGLIGLDTGFKELNSFTKGFKKNELIIIAARPGMGKTTLCLNFIDKTLRQNKGVVLFSLEMTASQILQRMIAARTSIALQKIITGDLNDDEWERVSDACDALNETEFHIYDGGYASLNEIRSFLRKLKTSKENIELCVIDYIGLMMSTSKFADRHLQVSEITRGLKMLAKEFDMPVIALSQLNRALESRTNKRPMCSDLRESGAIEQDADLILFVYRDEVYREQEEKDRENKAIAEGKPPPPKTFTPNKKQEEAEIIVGKNRSGPMGVVVKVLFLKEESRFADSTDFRVS